MADYTWADGESTNATKLNAIQQQLNIICTSATRPTGTEGMLIYESDTNRAYRYDGSTWQPDWAPPGTYTPTLTNVAIGTGGPAANTAKYGFASGLLSLSGVIVLGTSGASVSGTPIVRLPSGFTSNTADTADAHRFGRVAIVAAGGGPYFGHLYRASATTLGMVVENAASTYVTQSTISATVPATFTAGDYFRWNCVVPATFT